MAKKVINTTISDSAENNTTSPDVSPKQTNKLSTQVVFEPTASQAKLKAKFWTRFQPGPLTPADDINLSLAAQVTKSGQLKKWWSEPGFAEWFANKDEERERLKYLFHKGLDTMENILDNPEANANAKANLIKMLAEMNGYLGKKPAEKFSDEAINKMSEDQLKAFLERQGVTMTKETVIDAIATEADEEDSEAEKRGTTGKPAKGD